MDFRSWILAPGYSYLQTSNSNILFKYSNAKHLIVKCRSKKGKKEQTCSFDLDFFTNRPEMFHNSTTSTNRSIVLCQLHQRKKKENNPREKGYNMSTTILSLLNFFTGWLPCSSMHLPHVARVNLVGIVVSGVFPV